MMSTTTTNLQQFAAPTPFRSSAASSSSDQSSILPVLAHDSDGPVYAKIVQNPSNTTIPFAYHGPNVHTPGAREHGFSPYDFNGGTVAAVAGPDYVVVAADTRLSSGYEILSRNVSKLHTLNHTSTILASSGCKTDVDQLRSLLDIKMKIYHFNHHKDMSCDSVAQMVSNTLYYKRFFPYYAFNVMAGIDAQGKGAVYSYDAIGSYERTTYSANGSGQSYIIPVLDNVIGNRNRLDAPATPLSSEEVVEIFKDTFLSAGERDIYTGDAVEIIVLKADKTMMTHTFALKAD